MAITKSQLNFHETFQPEQTHLSRILQLAGREFSGDKTAISDETGIPTGKQKGKVKPTILYAAYMGLITYEYSKSIYALHLTDAGRVVAENDVYLQEDLTRWLCHYGLSRPDLGAPQWSYLVHNAHCGYLESISQEALMRRATQFFEVDISFAELFSVVRRSYQTGFLSPVDYVQWDDELLYQEHSYSPDLLYLYGYALLDGWRRCYPDQREITVVQIEEQIGLGKIFGLNLNDLNEVLYHLRDYGIVSMNRQLFPGTVIRTMGVGECLSSIYDCLL